MNNCCLAMHKISMWLVAWQWSTSWQRWRSEQSLSAWRSLCLIYITSLPTVVCRRVFADSCSFISPACCVSTPPTGRRTSLTRSGSDGSTTSCRCVASRRSRPTASRQWKKRRRQSRIRRRVSPVSQSAAGVVSRQSAAAVPCRINARRRRVFRLVDDRLRRRKRDLHWRRRTTTTALGGKK